MLGLVACGVGPAQAPVDPGIVLLPEFRIVNWNVSGLDPARHFPGKDLVVALLVTGKIDMIDANVVTLQEATVDTFQLLKNFLEPEWSCFAWSAGVDQMVTCVRGAATGFVGAPLSGDAGLPPEERWWGYTQLLYRDVTITNVHTRCGDQDGVCVKAIQDHVPELYDHVDGGLVVGDFNHEAPDVHGWYQTDPDPEYTLRTRQIKIDHVLSVVKPLWSWAYALDESHPYTEISNHRVLLTGVRLPTP
jgi:hypothetical protein